MCNMKRFSNTQYLFKVSLRHRNSMLRGVALMGHQTLADLHYIISDESGDGCGHHYSFRFANECMARLDDSSSSDCMINHARTVYDDGNASSVRLDDLKFKVNDEFEYVNKQGAIKWRKVIKVDSIDNG